MTILQLTVFFIALLPAGVTAALGGDTESSRRRDDHGDEESVPWGRFLQNGAVLVDGTEIGRQCRFEDSFTNPRLYCNVTTQFSSPSPATASIVAVDFVLGCNSTSSTLPFRQLANVCTCSAQINQGTTTTTTNSCTCGVCPQGMGTNAVWVDCSSGDDSFSTTTSLLGTCAVIDCDYTCNGSNVTEVVVEETSVPLQGEGNPSSPTTPSPPGNGNPSDPTSSFAVAGGLNALACVFLAMFLPGLIGCYIL